MTFQILVATMHQKDKSLLERMHICSDAIIINQTDVAGLERFSYNGHSILWLNTTERGLSRSRNAALQYATGDICLLADDDEILCDNYSDIVLGAFSTIPDADLITFNLNSIGNVRNRYFNKRIKRLHTFNIMRYGSARIAFRLDKIKKHSICMDVRFGAGEEISNGEDSIFLHDCLAQRLQAFAFNVTIADIHDETSTWFAGHDVKFFLDKGTIFTAMSPRWANFWIAQYVLRHYALTKEIGFFNATHAMIRGKHRYYNELLPK